MANETPLTIVFVAAEAVPYSKSGGLGEVVGDLPRALAALGHDVRIVIPKHRGVIPGPIRRHDTPLGVPLGTGEHWCAILETRLPGSEVPVYLLEHDAFFDRGTLYGYYDDLERFAFLSRASLQLCKALSIQPDVLHVHDWHAALVPVYLNAVEWNDRLGDAAVVYTIHNLGYQGVFTTDAFPTIGLGWEHFNERSLEHFGRLNLMKGGLAHSAVLTTVSPNYAREIQQPEHGYGLDGMLRARSNDLAGILNGIDEQRWNPETDPLIPANFTATKLGGKWLCKQRLQELSRLEVDPYRPLVGVISRLVGQKGLDVAADAMPYYLSMGAQVVVLGTGEPSVEQRFAYWAAHVPGSVAFHRAFSEDLAHWIEAGSDFFLMPSRYEPCGLNQMYSQRYGTLPIVRATGGLVDSVSNLDMENGTGTGFIFTDLDPAAVGNTVRWALSIYYDHPELLLQMRRRAMAQRFGWDRAAHAYDIVYRAAIERRRQLRS